MTTSEPGPSGVAVRPVRSSTDFDAFLAVPHVCQKADPVWVPPLNMMVREQLNPKKNPWFTHGEAQLFVAERDGRPVGRITAQVDHSHLALRNDATGFFGFFETIEDEAVATALFQAAESWLKDKGMTRVWGPFSLNINEESGLLIEGFESPPRMMMGHAQPYYGRLVEAAGYAKVRDMFAYLTPMDTALPFKQLKILKRSVERNPKLTYRSLDPKRYDEDIRIIVDIFNAAWAENWGFVPMTEADVAHMAKELKPILIPELVSFAFYEGEPAAMAVALPDLNEMIADLDGRLWPTGLVKLVWRVLTRRSFSSRTRVPLMGVMPQFKNKPLGSVLALLVVGAVREASLKLNLPVCEMSWVLEDNTATRHSIEDIGGRVYKTYRMYEKTLT